jgi:hypothetical protein
LHAHPAALSVVSSDSSDNRTGEAPVTQGEGERSTQSPASARRKPPPPHRGPIDSGKQETTQGIRKCTDVGVPREAAPPSHMRRAAPHAGSRAVMRQASAQGVSPGPRAPPPTAPGGCRSGAVARGSHIREDQPPPVTLEDPCRRPWKEEDGKEGEWKEEHNAAAPVVRGRRRWRGARDSGGGRLPSRPGRATQSLFNRSFKKNCS